MHILLYIIYTYITVKYEIAYLVEYKNVIYNKTNYNLMCYDIIKYVMTYWHKTQSSVCISEGNYISRSTTTTH